MLNLRKKLLVSIFTLMLALVAVSTTTYAWFTMGKEVNVTGINMAVKGEDGLTVRVVSINGTDAKLIDQSILDEDKKVSAFKSDLDLSKALEGVNLSPLTYDKSEERLEYLDGVEAVAATNKYYIHIEFEFFSNTDLTVYFNDIQSAVNGNFSFTTPINIPGYGAVSAVNAGQAVTDARLANALRIAYSGYVASSTTPSSIDGDGNVVPMTMTYPTAPKYSTNVIAPVLYDARNTSGQLINQYGTWLGASVHYYNSFVNDANHLDTPTGSEKDYFGYVITGEGKETGKEKEAFADTSIVQLKGTENEVDGYYGRATVTIWLEGWDSDCFNAIVEDTASLSISFEGKSSN